MDAKEIIKAMEADIMKDREGERTTYEDVPQKEETRHEEMEDREPVARKEEVPDPKKSEEVEPDWKALHAKEKAEREQIAARLEAFTQARQAQSPPPQAPKPWEIELPAFKAEEFYEDPAKYLKTLAQVVSQETRRRIWEESMEMTRTAQGVGETLSIMKQALYEKYPELDEHKELVTMVGNEVGREAQGTNTDPMTIVQRIGDRSRELLKKFGGGNGAVPTPKKKPSFGEGGGAPRGPATTKQRNTQEEQMLDLIKSGGI